ncbi:MAG: hypothetical protein HYX38_28295 [Rhodospirillales bacterium]|nr:hypothetical protein [Rhodospirillales bacterium]
MRWRLSPGHDPAGLSLSGDGIVPVAVRPPPAARRRTAGALRPWRHLSVGSLSVGFDFGDGSRLDDWTARGFDAWAFDFAGFGDSDRYPEMGEPADRHAPLGRAPEAALQVASSARGWHPPDASRNRPSRPL